MRGKLWFVGGIAVGFVLGARAGREKYEELVQNARKMWDHPTVQEAAGVVQAQANRLYHEGKDSVTDKLSHTRLGEKLAPSETSSEAPLATTAVGSAATGGSASTSTTGSTGSSGSTGSTSRSKPSSTDSTTF